MRLSSLRINIKNMGAFLLSLFAVVAYLTNHIHFVQIIILILIVGSLGAGISGIKRVLQNHYTKTVYWFLILCLICPFFSDNLYVIEILPIIVVLANMGLDCKDINVNIKINILSILLTLYLLIIAISSIRSHNLTVDVLFWVCKFIFIIILCSYVVDNITNQHNFELLLESIIFSIYTGIIIIWILSLVLFNRCFSQISFGNMQYRFGGTIVHPTTMALLAGLSVLYFYILHFEAKNRGGNNFLMLMIMTISLVSTGGRAGIVATIIAVALAYFSRGRESKVKVILLLFLSLLILYFVFLLFDISREELFTALGRGDIRNIITLSGRADVFSYSIKLFLEKPLLGYGYTSSYELLANSQYYFSSYSNGIDNAYLMILIDTGILGFLIVASILVITFNRIFRSCINKRVHYNLFFVSKTYGFIFVIILLHALLSPSFGCKARVHTFLLVIVIAITDNLQRYIKTSTSN